MKTLLEIGLLEQDKEGLSLPLSNVKWEMSIIITYPLGGIWIPLRSRLLPHTLTTKTFGNENCPLMSCIFFPHWEPTGLLVTVCPFSQLGILKYG